MISQQSVRVALLSGGESSEREISLRSGDQVSEALAAAGHAVVRFDPRDRSLETIPWAEFEACFLALHGGEGEGGGVQAWLAERQIPFTGSDAQASRRAMDKAAAKTRFTAAGVPTPPWRLLPEDSPPNSLADTIAPLEFPLIVKPNAHGSSLGLGLARDLNETARCIAESRQYDPQVLVERFISGREFTVAVLGDTPLPLIEVMAHGRLFDYESKYSGAGAECGFSHGLPPMKDEELRQTAAAAAKALGTSGLVRVDLMLDATGCPWVLEVNTLPGMTARSTAPRAAARVGMDLPALCDWMLRDALKNADRLWPDRKRNNPPSPCRPRLSG